MRLDALTIPHDAQRYNTVGDYYYPYKGHVRFRISELGNEDYEFLVLLHEIVEEYLCRKAGISEAEITSWDLAHAYSPDPGSEAGCPYGMQHTAASSIESAMASLLAVNWADYEAEIAACCEKGQGPEPPDEELANA